MSIKAKARIAGVLYLIVIVTAGFAEAYARGRLIVRSDAALTAANIKSHELLYRAGGVADAVNFVCDIAIALLLFEIFKGVSTTLAAITVAYRLAGDVMGMIITVVHFGPLYFPADALTFMRMHSVGYNVAMTLFGTHLTLLGYLLMRSEYAWRPLGAILSLAGVCYLFGSIGRMFSPPFAAHFFPYILYPGIAAEFALAIWLLAMPARRASSEVAAMPATAIN
jgi:uncharacterized protein DUF4386